MQAIHAALPRAAVTNVYGTTEAGPVVFGPHPQGLPLPNASLGYPHPQVALRLVNGHDRNADEGVLEMKCPAMMNGYHNRPDVAAPFTADGFYITGDVFRRDAEGFYYIVGRTDEMFVSGGENIFRPRWRACWNAIPTSCRPRWCRSRTRSRARSRSPSSSASRGIRSTRRR